MDIPKIAQEVVAFLVPFLPYLVKAGEKAAESVGEKLGTQAWEKAQALWEKLRGHERVKEAAEETAAMPDDPDAQAALRFQVKGVLKQHEALAREIAELMAEARQAGSKAIAAGERSVAVGGSVTGSTIITGDGNVVGDHSSSVVKE